MAMARRLELLRRASLHRLPFSYCHRHASTNTPLPGLELSAPPPPAGFSASSDRIRFLSRRSFASSAPSPSNIVLLGSAEQFNAAMAKVKDESSPAIFYFTAVWCGPCRFIAPKIEELSRTYPHVTTYKIDIDQDGLGSILSQLQIFSVPTFQFYQNGKKASEVVGADAGQLVETMENLYKYWILYYGIRSSIFA